MFCTKRIAAGSSVWAQLAADRSGFIVSIELLLVVTICVLGLMVGATSIRDAVTSEVSDVAGAVQDLSQCYSVSGMAGHSSKSSGMNYLDLLDFCDSNEDLAESIDNCIVVDSSPEDEQSVPEGSALSLLFADDATDTSIVGEDNSGTLQGDAEIVDGMLILDGDGDFVSIPDSTDINLGTHPERTIALDFKADDVTTRQVLYEEGAGARGLVIYIDDGNLYVGGWNIPDSESGWDPVYISTPITAGEWFSVALVLDGGPTITPDALTGFLDGTAFGSAPGSQLWPHGGDIGIGGINQSTIFHDGVQASGAYFGGMIDNFNLYGEALSNSEIGALSN